MRAAAGANVFPAETASLLIAAVGVLLLGKSGIGKSEIALDLVMRGHRLVADDIVNLAFGLTLGAIAVAFALAFGLGGREAAGKLMDHWLTKCRRED